MGNAPGLTEAPNDQGPIPKADRNTQHSNTCSSITCLSGRALPPAQRPGLPTL
eukprot:NODE_10148_length_450_cov_2.371571_g9044_i0.p1 GENE.NODE_10148_length_450_cov_2.371571_g9044_i0~~NODE_10148_length_450_cov_2.371571_g9044_i0.p1  ORF type:complete len:61 (+),score=7.92 NODE_10148_length_450_cov_2.371571_g9044_i0:26-184(+)